MGCIIEKIAHDTRFRRKSTPTEFRPEHTDNSFTHTLYLHFSYFFHSDTCFGSLPHDYRSLLKQNFKVHVICFCMLC